MFFFPWKLKQLLRYGFQLSTLEKNFHNIFQQQYTNQNQYCVLSFGLSLLWLSCIHNKLFRVFFSKFRCKVHRSVTKRYCYVNWWSVVKPQRTTLAYPDGVQSTASVEGVHVLIKFWVLTLHACMCAPIYVHNYYRHRGKCDECPLHYCSYHWCVGDWPCWRVFFFLCLW